MLILSRKKYASLLLWTAITYAYIVCVYIHAYIYIVFPLQSLILTVKNENQRVVFNGLAYSSTKKADSFFFNTLFNTNKSWF